MHHDTENGFQKSASENCFICWRLRDQWMSRDQTTLESGNVKGTLTDTSFRTKYSLEPYGDDDYRVGIMFELSAAKYSGLPYHFLCTPASERSELLTNYEVSSNSTDSTETIEFARISLHKCLQNHVLCGTRRARNRSWCPTRLLKLDHPTKNHITLFNHSKADDEDFSTYITLSHCWGRKELIRLTSLTYPSLAEGLPAEALPRTFQDAINVTRSLGVSFIWIDSLCIFQDSKEDWVIEAERMGQVYSNALCNIAATASSSPDQGFFRPRNQHVLQRTEIASSWNDFPNTKYHIFDRFVFRNHFLLDSPLLQRAWVTQEHYLSARFIHFGAQQVFWECREIIASEMYKNGVPSDIASDGIVAKRDDMEWEDMSANDRREKVYTVWCDLVHNYSGYGLTVETDKLIAISGIAKRIQEISDDQYLAGMWKSHLPVGLLWRVWRSRRPYALSASYRAPSWSWASVKERVFLNSQEPFPGIELVKDRDFQASTVLASNDPTGEIVSASLRMSAFLITVIYKHDPEGRISQLFMDGQWSDVSNQWYDSKRTIVDSPPPVAIANGTTEFKLHFLPIWHGYVSSKEEVTRVTGLLLQPTGKMKGEFSRFTYINLALDRAFTLEWPKEFVGIRQESWLEYEEFDGVNKYDFTIV
ncbi:HET-domain-containing protein [Acephala macrosclerotiorum]|nr:HET-domain-containing protein [Acephala macrosclerotiorum]